jgi:hypothetical protein
MFDWLNSVGTIVRKRPTIIQKNRTILFMTRCDMTQKERLVELIKQKIDCDREGIVPEWLANHLIANGVVVPLCKVGQTVYVITNKHPCYACKWCSDFCHRDCHIENKTELVVRKAKVDAVCFLDGVNEIHVEIEGTKNLHRYSSTFYFHDFGKTVFLTREEAEKALAERYKQ